MNAHSFSTRLLATLASAFVVLAPAGAAQTDIDASPTPLPGVRTEIPGVNVQLSGSYTHAFAMYDSTEAASGAGIAARVTAPLVGPLGVSARVGLDRLGIDQRSAIEQWNWGYWDVLWGTWSQIYQNRDDIDAAFQPVQNALLLNAAVAPSLTLGSSSRSVTAWAGPSLTYFARRLYNRETWERDYPTIDHQFEYTLRNYAPDKTGFAFGVDAGLSARQKLSSWLDLAGSVSYRRIQFDTSTDLPFDDMLSVDVGVALRY